MTRAMMIFLVGMLVAYTAMVQADDNISVDTMPPVVVSTFPEAGDTTVDPGINEIRVTFSKEMMTHKMWSWVIVSKESFPQIVGDVHYLDDNRTCVAPVKLDAGKTYGIWFNSAKYKAFRDTNNNPAIPYLLVFQTRE